MIALRDCYKSLAPESRGHYWVLVTNVFLVIFTFWLGICIQDLVANKNAKASLKLAHYEIVDRMQDKYFSVYDSCGSIISELYKITYASINKKEQTKEIYRYINMNKEDILYSAKCIVNIVGEYKYYFDSQKTSNASLNNSLILVGLKLLAIINNKENLTNELLKKDLINYMATPEFMIKGSLNSRLLELSNTMIEMFEKIQRENKKEDYEREIIKNFILVPELSNIMLLTDEINYANDGDESFLSTINIILKSKSIYALIPLIFFALLVCEFFIRTFAPISIIKNEHKKYNEIDNKIKQYETEIQQMKDSFKSQYTILVSKDEEIKELKRINSELEKDADNKDMKNRRGKLGLTKKLKGKNNYRIL